MEARRVVGLFVSMAFLLHGACMLNSGAYSGAGNKDKQNTVKAMLIIAFLLYFFALLFSFLAIFTAVISEKTAIIVAGLCGILGGICTIIGVAIHNDAVSHIDPYPLTVYVVSACLGILAGILAILGIKSDAV